MNSDEFAGLTPEQRKLVDEIVAQLRGEVRDAAIRFRDRVFRHGAKILRGNRLRRQGFQERRYSRWARPLDLYELCLYIAQECGKYFYRKFYPKDAATEDYKFETLARLQARAALVAGEIYALLLSGFPSGAHARWRTLHEIAVTASFIAQEDEEAAERYANHQLVKSYEDAKEYQKHAASLNVEPYSDEEMARIKHNYDVVLARYGVDFRRGYGWAIPALLRHNSKLKGNKMIGFSHVQAAVKREYWNPQHRMASHAVHPSATFLRFMLGCREDMILTGPSNLDLAEAGQGAVLALAGATDTLTTYEPATRDVVALERRATVSVMATVLNVLADMACREFVKVHEELEEEIRAEKGNPPRLSGRAPRKAKGATSA